MTSPFEKKKQVILQQLSVSDSDYTDLSPKGSVDEGIKELVNGINQLDGYVTTSSCAGRIAVFLEGIAKREATSSENEATSVPTPTSQGGKGGGSWLYVSHDPIDLTPSQQPGQLLALFGLQTSEISCPAPGQHVRYIHFKFEPMILHILTSSLQHAQDAHSAAMSAGFRESGISGVTAAPHTPRKQQTNDGGTAAGTTASPGTDACTPLLAVRTSGLAFDSIVAYRDTATGSTRPMVSEEYLRTLVGVANARFAVNGERKRRFADALFRRRRSGDHERARDHGDAGSSWEPAEVRRARKRAEGLRRRDELARRKDDGRGETADQGRAEDGMGLERGALG